MVRLPYVLAVLAVCALTLSVATPASAQLGSKFSDFQQSELFTKYGLKQSDASIDEIGIWKDLEVFKPTKSDYSDMITVVMEVDSTQTVRSISLTIARSLINNRATAKYAADFTVAFLQTALPDVDKPRFTDLINQIQWPRGVVYPNDIQRPTLPDYPTSDYITYLGKNKIFVRGFSKVALHMENITSPTMPSFSLSLMLR